MQKTMPIQIQVLGSDEIEKEDMFNEDMIIEDMIIEGMVIEGMVIEGMGYLTLLTSSPGRGNARQTR